MDKKFIELWGNSLICSAKSQQQLEDAAKCLMAGFTGLQEMNRMFFNMFGFETSPKAPDYFSLWDKPMSDFLNTCREFFSMIDLVPRKAYNDLEEENKKLRKQLEELEKQKPIHSMIEEEINMAAEGVKGLQGIVEDQSRRFQKLVEDMGKAFTSPEKKAPARSEKPKKPASRKPKVS